MQYKMTYRNGKNIREHRAIMQDFLGRELNKNELVHHIDGDIRNNNITNLYVTTRQEHAKIHCDKIKRNISVIQYSKKMEFIKMWESATKAAIELNISNTNISACCRMRIKSAYGFIWRYADV